MHLENADRPSILRNRRSRYSHAARLVSEQPKALDLAVHSDSVQKDSYDQMLVQPLSVQPVVSVELVTAEWIEELAADNCTEQVLSSCRKDWHFAELRLAVGIAEDQVAVVEIQLAEQIVIVAAGQIAIVAAAVAAAADSQTAAAGKHLVAGSATGWTLGLTVPSCRDLTLAAVGPAVG